ncbi:MAG: hypothetical protein ACK53L_22465, partial [Pirellulaceae bacterium]
AAVYFDIEITYRERRRRGAVHGIGRERVAGRASSPGDRIGESFGIVAASIPEGRELTAG